MRLKFDNLSKEYPCIDILKFFFSILVIFMHTSPLHKLQPQVNFLIINGLGKIAVPFFFTASGFFLFRRKNLDGKTFGTYLKRLIILYLFWNIVYWLIEMFFLGRVYSFEYFLKFIFFNTSPLWYIEALIKSIIILYVLNKFLSWKTILILFFLVTIIFSFKNFYLFDNFYKTVDFTNYFRLSSIFFVALGAFMGNFKRLDRIYSGKYLSLIIFCFMLILLVESATFKYIVIKLNKGTVNPEHYLVLPFLIFFIFYYCLSVQKINMKLNFNRLRKYSSIIYFSHFTVKLFFVGLFTNHETPLFEIFRFCFVLIGSLLISFILVKLEKTRFYNLTKYIY